MKFVDRLLSRWGYHRSAPLPKATTMGMQELSAPFATMQNLMAQQLQSPVVQTAVSLVTETAAAARLHVDHQPKGSVDKANPIPDHPFAALVNDHPNPLMDGFEMKEKTYQWHELTGNAYWFYSSDGADIREIYPLRPDRVALKLGGNYLITHYVYIVNGARLEIPAAFITHFKYPHPLDDWFGLSPLQAALLELATDKAMALYNYSFFGRKVAKDDGLFILPASLSDERFDESKNLILDDAGRERATIFIRAGVENEPVQFIPRSAKQKDMEFISGRSYTRQEILEILGIPTGMMSEASTEAHARVAERRFLSRIYNRHLRTAGKLTNDILPFYGTNLRARFDDVRIADAQQVRDKLTAMKGIATPNEQRQELNLPATPEGDKIIQLNPKPTDQAEENKSANSQQGVRTELAQFRRYAEKRDWNALQDFSFRAIGTETQKELLAACAVAEPETRDNVILSFYGRNYHDLAR